VAATAHGTLTANTVTSVTVTADTDGLQVVNRSKTGAIWVRIDGGTPAVAGADSFVVLGVRSFSIRIKGALTVKLISDDALDYSVEAD
jgi:hypothetical protein